jgi:hypothetical protein
MDRVTDARNLKTSQLLTATLDAYHALLVERWETSAETHVADRERAHAGIRALKELREFLDDAIATGIRGDTTGTERAA